MQFVGYPLCRSLPDRDKAAKLVKFHLASSDTRFVLISGRARGRPTAPLTNTALMDKTIPEKRRIAFFKRQDLESFGVEISDPMFLGHEPEPLTEELSENSRAIFALYVADLDDRAEKIVAVSCRKLEVCAFENVEVCEARALFNQDVDKSEMAILGYAWCLARFHSGHNFDARTGLPTAQRVDGRARFIKLEDGKKCSVYPRTDPVAIVLIESPDGNSILLASNKRRRARTYFSCIAGFIEPGEALEDAVKREVWEESGVKLHSIEYQASQPWPLSASMHHPQLMLGLKGRATKRQIEMHDDENSAVRWFSSDEIGELLKEASTESNIKSIEVGGGDKLRLPGSYSIAGHLIRKWHKENSKAQELLKTKFLFLATASFALMIAVLLFGINRFNETVFLQDI